MGKTKEGASMMQPRVSDGRDRRDARAGSMSRKDFLKVGGAGFAGAALLGSGALAGCGGGDEGGSGDIVFSWLPEQTGTLDKMIQRFNKQNEDGIKVVFRKMPSDSTQHFDKLLTEFQAGSADIDVIGGDVIWPAQFASNGYYLDLSDRFTKSDREKFLPAPLQANTWEDKIYGVPWYTDSGMLYYRKDLFEKSGVDQPPKTWEELKTIARKVQQEQDIKYGFVFEGAEYEGGVCNGLEYIWTHGGDVLAPNDPNKVVVNSEASLAALRTQRSMVKDGISPKSVVSYKEQEAQNTFLNGDAVFMRNWPYIYGLAADEKESKVRQEQIGVAALPVGKSGDQTFSALGGWNFSINANSKNPDAAWKFIQYMTAPKQQKEFSIKTSRIPTRKSLLEDPEIVDVVPVVKLGKEAISRTRPRPVSQYYSDLSLKMAARFNDSLNGDESPEQAIKDLESQMKEIMQQG